MVIPIFLLTKNGPFFIMNVTVDNYFGNVDISKCNSKRVFLNC